MPNLTCRIILNSKHRLQAFFDEISDKKYRFGEIAPVACSQAFEQGQYRMAVFSILPLFRAYLLQGCDKQGYIGFDQMEAQT